MTTRILGVIGGSGLYAMAGLESVREHRVTTTFGEPSDAIVEGTLGETRLLFLPRHGRGHRLPPHRINYRANILALKQLGAEQLVSVSAVGSLRETIHPGEVVVVDQFIDRTRSRPNTFFEDDGVVAHVEFAQPTDAALGEVLYRSALAAGATVHRGGAYVCIEGPQFSTRAESELFRSWERVSVVGMTNLPEARLAREAELPYATLALVTDYDCWKDSEAAVSVDSVLAVLERNVELARETIQRAVTQLPDPTLSPASRALERAILTPKAQVSPTARARLRPLIERYLG